MPEIAMKLLYEKAVFRSDRSFTLKFNTDRLEIEVLIRKYI